MLIVAVEFVFMHENKKHCFLYKELNDPNRFSQKIYFM